MNSKNLLYTCYVVSTLSTLTAFVSVCTFCETQFNSHQRTQLNLFHSAVGCSVGDNNRERVTEIQQQQQISDAFPLRKKASTHSRTCPVAKLQHSVLRLVMVEKMIFLLVLWRISSSKIVKHS